MITTNKNQINRWLNQFRNIFKAGITGVLILLMLIPTEFVKQLVEERQDRQKEVVSEVSLKWAAAQTFTGPFLRIPYLSQLSSKQPVKKYAYVLPASLNVHSKLQPEIKKRSIYEVALYKNVLQADGRFDVADLGLVAGPDEQILWNEATICIGISDTRGIADTLTFAWNKVPLTSNASVPENPIASSGVSIPVDLSTKPAEGYSFNLEMKLKGSERFMVMPIGKTTAASMSSPWNSPSFNGGFLPDYQLSKDGFTANWRVMHYNRNFPQIWKDATHKIDEYAFGLSLLQPADNYAKTMRSVKYAILFIGLTFSIFLLIELMQRRPVHPVQYVLVGLALIIFYTLLLSIGEYTGFDIAYAIAAVATVLLVSFYTIGLFASAKTGWLFGGFLALLYAFIYILIQLEETSLLVGSIGLFVMLAAAMHFSKKIDWYGSNTSQEAE